jgi:hypothetical protein
LVTPLSILDIRHIGVHPDGRRRRDDEV